MLHFPTKMLILPQKSHKNARIMLTIQRLFINSNVLTRCYC